MKSEIKGENFIKIKFRVVNVYKVTIQNEQMIHIELFIREQKRQLLITH